MTEVETTRESYDFRCGRCGHAWERVYEVRRWRDQCGDEFTCYRADGVRAVAPGNAVCPRCGGYRIRLLPVHTPSGVPRSAGQHRTEPTAWPGWAVLSEICHVPGLNHS